MGSCLQLYGAATHQANRSHTSARVLVRPARHLNTRLHNRVAAQHPPTAPLPRSHTQPQSVLARGRAQLTMHSNTTTSPHTSARVLVRTARQRALPVRHSRVSRATITTATAAATALTHAIAVIQPIPAAVAPIPLPLAVPVTTPRSPAALLVLLLAWHVCAAAASITSITSSSNSAAARHRDLPAPARALTLSTLLAAFPAAPAAVGLPNLLPLLLLTLPAAAAPAAAVVIARRWSLLLGARTLGLLLLWLGLWLGLLRQLLWLLLLLLDCWRCLDPLLLLLLLFCFFQVLRLHGAEHPHALQVVVGDELNRPKFTQLWGQLLVHVCQPHAAWCVTREV